MPRNQITRVKAWDNSTILAGSTNYSDPTSFRGYNGAASILVVSSDGQITVTYQLSSDGVNWYIPMNTSKTSLGVLCTDLAVTAGTYIAFAPAYGKYIRFKLVENGTAETIVTITLAFRTEV
jgi:hypothetical protein